MPSIKLQRNAIKAFLIAPLATPICVLFWSLIQGKISNDHGSLEILLSLGSTVIVFGVPAELAGVVFGLPLWLLYRRFHISSSIAYAFGGAVISQLVMSLLAMSGSILFLTGSEGGAGMLQGLPLSLACGITSGVAFWRITGNTY